MNDSYRSPRRSREHLVLDLVRNALKEQNIVKMQFIGNSMIPSIKNGETVTIKKKLPGTIKIGEVVVFDRGNDLICHRVVWKVYLDKLYFLTRGDNIPFCDRPVPEEAVYGKIVLSNVKQNAILKISLRNKLLFLLCIILLKLERKISAYRSLVSIFNKRICSLVY